MLYKFEANKKEDAKEQMKLEDFPKLSGIVQDEQHGFIADISAAIKNNETPEDPEAKLASCLLPSTTFEFEKSEKVQQISAIRGLTPGKDLQIQLSDTLTSVSQIITFCILTYLFYSIFSSWSPKLPWMRDLRPSIRQP